MQSINSAAQSFSEGVSNLYHNAKKKGQEVVSEVKETINSEEIQTDAKEISTMMQIGYGFAVFFTVISVAGAFFSLIHFAPFSFLICTAIFLASLDALFASQKVIEVAKKMYDSPHFYALLTSREARCEMFKNSAIENTLILKNFIPITKRQSLN